MIREIKPYTESSEESLEDQGFEGCCCGGNYENRVEKYYDILEKYENHVYVDFLFAKLDLKHLYYKNKGCLFFENLFAWGRYLTGFSAHFAVMILVFSWVVFYVFPVL